LITGVNVISGTLSPGLRARRDDGCLPKSSTGHSMAIRPYFSECMAEKFAINKVA
jgi:hypothetical protein